MAIGFTALVALTAGLIVLGALVRAHGAGLACPDWPLCFGRLVPEFDLKVGFEWGHRLVAGGISLLFVALGVATLRSPLLRPVAGRWIVIGAALLLVQVLLGALTVWKLLASWSVTSHLLAGNAFAVCLLFITLSLFEASAPRPRRTPISRVVRTAVSVAMAVLTVQMMLGGLVSSTYAGLACPEWPTCAEGVFFPSFAGAQGLHLLHRMGGYSTLVILAVCTWAGRNIPGLAGPLALALVLVLAQVVIGVANVLLRIPVEITGLHSGLAAALVLTLSAATREVWRRKG